jgi:hypothetical protein
MQAPDDEADEIPHLTGIPELPLNPEVKLRRDREPPEQNTEKNIAALGELGYLPYEFAMTGSASTPEEQALPGRHGAQ